MGGLYLKSSFGEEYFKNRDIDELESLAKEFGWKDWDIRWEDTEGPPFGYISEVDAQAFAEALERALPHIEDKCVIPEEHKEYLHRITDEKVILKMKDSGEFVKVEEAHGLRPGSLSKLSLEELKDFFSNFGWYGMWAFTTEGWEAYEKLPVTKKLSGHKWLIESLIKILRGDHITILIS